MSGKSQFLRDMIFWQYANLIAKSAGFGKNNYFIIKKYKHLKSGEITWSTLRREYEHEFNSSDSCIYCGAETDLTVEHMIPVSRGGPDHPDNFVRVCKHCNSSKGNKGVYEYFGYENRNKIPRIAEGKYLKLLYSKYEKRGILMVHVDDIEQLCNRCYLREKCPVPGEYNVYCIEGVY
jgi:hypothetical protein